MEIRARNTNDLMLQVYPHLAAAPEQSSRNGPVRRIMEPVSILLTHPWERVNFHPVRDANPYFHLMEGLAMLAAFNNVPFLAHFAKSFAQFSDDGQTVNAFYGTRARRWNSPVKDMALGMDQLDLVIADLQKNPDSRQEIVQLWTPMDLVRTTKDKACNLCMLFDVRDGYLWMTTFNRSNDAVLGGVSGANIVHLSMFQEYVAAALDFPMGGWWHVSNNLHVYTDQPQWLKLFPIEHHSDPYPNMTIVPLFESALDKSQFDVELAGFLGIASALAVEGKNAHISPHFGLPFINGVAVPMFNAWQSHKDKRDHAALNTLSTCIAPDWRDAAVSWITRRLK
jgi:thymidylate synthase